MPYSLSDWRKPAVPTSTQNAAAALTEAERLNGRSQSALNGARSSASTLKNYAGGMYSTGRGLVSQYNDAFAPLVNSLPGMANIPLQNYVNDAANAVHGQYDRARGVQGRELARMGVNPASGRMAGLLGTLSRDEAADAAGAMTNARFAGQRENFQRSLSAAGVGQGLLSGGMGAMSAGTSATGQAAGIQQNIAGQYGQLSNEAAQYGNLLANMQSAAPVNSGALAPAGGSSAPVQNAAPAQNVAPQYISNQPSRTPAAPVDTSGWSQYVTPYARGSASLVNQAPALISNAPAEPAQKPSWNTWTF